MVTVRARLPNRATIGLNSTSYSPLFPFSKPTFYNFLSRLKREQQNGSQYVYSSPLFLSGWTSLGCVEKPPGELRN